MKGIFFTQLVIRFIKEDNCYYEFIQNVKERINEYLVLDNEAKRDIDNFEVPKILYKNILKYKYDYIKIMSESFEEFVDKRLYKDCSFFAIANWLLTQGFRQKHRYFCKNFDKIFNDFLLSNI